MSLVTFKCDFSVPPKKRSEAQLLYCFDDTVDLSDEDKARVDAWVKELKEAGIGDGKTPYVEGSKDLREHYVAPRPDSPSYEEKKSK